MLTYWDISQAIRLAVTIFNKIQQNDRKKFEKWGFDLFTCVIDSEHDVQMVNSEKLSSV